MMLFIGILEKETFLKMKDSINNTDIHSNVMRKSFSEHLLTNWKNIQILLYDSKKSINFIAH